MSRASAAARECAVPARWTCRSSISSSSGMSLSANTGNRSSRATSSIHRAQQFPRETETARRTVARAEHHDAAEQSLVDLREHVVRVVVERPGAEALSGTSKV